MKSHHWTGAGTEWQRLPRPKKSDIVAARRDLKQTRFLADESVEVAVAVLLRRQGFNVVHTSEARMRGHPDENSFAYAAREDRVLLTRDTDFLDNHAFPPHLNPGLIVLPSPSTAARNKSARDLGLGGSHHWALSRPLEGSEDCVLRRRLLRRAHIRVG